MRSHLSKQERDDFCAGATQRYIVASKCGSIVPDITYVSTGKAVVKKNPVLNKFFLSFSVLNS